MDAMMEILKDICFLLSFAVAIVSALAMVIFVGRSEWLEFFLCGFAFIASIVIAFRLAMSAALSNY